MASHEDWDWLPNYSPDGRLIPFNSYRVEAQSHIHLFEKLTGTLRCFAKNPSYDSLILFRFISSSRDIAAVNKLAALGSTLGTSAAPAR